MSATTPLNILTLPVMVDGNIVSIDYEVKDAYARQLIEDIGHAVYWVGVTTTALTDGATTNPIQVNGEAKTAKLGGLASYNGSEFVWNGSAWQEMGKNNFGALAFKSSASGTYTPAGNVSITPGTDSTDSVTGVTSVGTLPSCYFTVDGEHATLNFSAGTLPTADTAKTFMTARGTDTAAFTGTAATITVE